MRSIFLLILALMASIVLSSKARASTERFIGCQYGSEVTDVVVVAELDGDSISFNAQDDDVKVKDYSGQITRLDIQDVIHIEARSRGMDAWNFLTIKADTVNKIIYIEQSEIRKVSTHYNCKAVTFKL